MPILAGQIIEAAVANRLQPKSYSVTGTGNLVGPVSNADVPGCSYTFNTETAGATYKAWIVIDHDLTNPTTVVGFGRLVVDGVNQPTTTGVSRELITDRTVVGQNYHGTLASAGAHTFKVVGSPPASQQILGANTTLVIEITEVV